MSDSVKHVLVTVDRNEQVRCTPDPVNVSGTNVLIAFRLLTEGYAYPDQDAIVVTNPGSTFPYASWTLNPQLATQLDVDNADGDFSYTVNVVQVASGRHLSVDPTIRNEN